MKKSAEFFAMRFKEEFNCPDYSYESVEYLSQIIESFRKKVLPNLEKDDHEFTIFCIEMACFLGQCIIEHYGGEWDEDELCVVKLHTKNEYVLAYPHQFVLKQLEYGYEEYDVCAFFKAVSALLK